MSGTAGKVLLLVIMIILIVGLDVLFFRNLALARLLSAVGLVLVAGAFYVRFFTSS